MLPTERRQVLQQRVINGMAVATQRVRSPFQIDRVPQHDGSRYQIEAASPVALLLETAVADFTQAVEKHGTGQCVARLALVQPGMHAAAQLDALQPVQDEQRALDAPQLAQGDGQAVLAWVAAELSEHQGGRHRALLDRGGQPQDFVPMGADVLDVERAADHRLERVIGGIALRDVELGVAQVADARREAEAQEVHQGEDVIGEARRVGVMLLDPQVGLVVQQAVEHVGRIAHADVHDLGVKWRVLVRNVGVERPPWAAPVFRVDVAGALGLAARAEVLAVRR